MRRADRLFKVIQLLRGRRRAVTASWLAEQLSVSERTIYRDVRDLIVAGTPIAGEAGVGYTIRRDYDLPPLMFDAEELEALVLALVGPARSVISKVEAVLPPRLKVGTRRPALYAPRTYGAEIRAHALDTVRAALTEKRKLKLRYQREDEKESYRTILPLGAFFWGRSWTLTAWCELRNDFRNFRLDRVLELHTLDETFTDEPGRSLRDYLRSMGHSAEQILDD